MKVSVITVCKDSESTIRQTIESVLAQSYENIEYIVVDGCSSDATLDIVGEYLASICKIISERDCGIYDAMNKGLAIATGDVVAFLNSDDVYSHCNVVSNVVRQFEETGADIVFGNLVYVDRNEPSQVLRFYSSKSFAPWMLRFGFMPPHPATFLRAEVYQRVGCYDTSYRISSDYEFLIRALHNHGTSFSWMDDILVAMKSGGVSTRGLSNSWQLNREIVKACNENGLRTCLAMIAIKLPFKLRELVGVKGLTKALSL